MVSRQLVPRNSAEILAQLFVENLVVPFPPATPCERSWDTCESKSYVAKLHVDKVVMKSFFFGKCLKHILLIPG